ncbi:hypothetical protein VSH64_13675 [Amycolatopsis rhabdoformis]|uniref:Serine/threonine protein kinase n=1 Tax=Amycolatopsis rhabdoformis TaxID=1448059 RepID=A0ABZ1IHZ2_9PSEU|nr:hypothetical protein [Amycolatopsis rhabdoformis]WSE33154.1 hypothetical protein VSH64_13675 [Amycolatopsis rhabdoformis]
MPPSKPAWRPLLAAWLVLPALAACSGEPAPRAAVPPPPSATTAPAPTSSTRPAPPPPPEPTHTTSSKPARPSTTPTAVPGSCGTVTAASGLTLYVFDSQAGGVPCAEAMRLVRDFHAQIAGRQGSGSNDAVNDTVSGWLCTSGPPAAQGGTTCSKGEQTVFAAVVPSE